MKFHPNIFIVGRKYQIVIVTEQPAQVCVWLDGKTYFEDNGGIIPSLNCVHKISVPQSALDKAGKYTVVVRNTVEKKPYRPVYGERKTYEYTFKNRAYDDLKAVYFADIHSVYRLATALVGDREIDFVIFNGDFGETRSTEDILHLNEFFSSLTKGEIPVLFVRGNHDTRGAYAERLYETVGMDGQKGYFSFTFRSLCGVALDCGEDKPDDHIEYGGANDFESYRKRQTEFLRRVRLPKDKTAFAVCHVPFMLESAMHGEFDIERKEYARWAKSLNGLNLRFMICGHTHRFAYVPEGNDVQSHDYPVLVASEFRGGVTIGGAFLDFTKTAVRVTYADSDGKTYGEYEL